MTRFWRADYLGGDRSAGKFAFKLDGPVSEEDFAKTHSLRAMEYGVGDTVRIPAFASLRRIEDNVYELRANADAKVTFADGKVHEVKLADLARSKGKVRIAVRPGR